jgi:hypothetical protein
MGNTMTPAIDIAPLIGDALNALRDQTGLEAVVEPQVQANVDAVIAIKRGPKVWHFNVEVKPWLNKTTLGFLKEQIRARVGEWLLVTRYIAAGQADELRTTNLAFLDTVGNAFINQEDLYVFIKGQGVGRDRRTRKGDIFRPAELKVLFAFLCQKGLEEKTYEQIKEMTGVGLGTINRLIRALEQAGYILKLKGRTRRLVRKRELLDQWVMAYPQRLRPKQVIGRFTGPREPWWMDIDPMDFDAQWGGEIAAKYLTQYLKPQLVTLYAAKKPNDLIIKQKLREDPEGDIEILRRFWNFPKLDEKANVVPTLLVYADLLATGDERNIETARMIYERYIAGLIGEG